jgi:hypothetical protein
MLKVVKIPWTLWQLTVWAWQKADQRQRKPTAGIGFIVERR